MRYKMLVAANAAVFGASGIAVAMPAVAQTTSASSSTSSDAMDLQQLQRQISALQAKVDQLEQQEQQEQTKQAAPAPEPVAKSELSAWADNTKISGTMFIDFNNIDQTSNGAKTSASGTGLDVKRFYLSIDHKFDDIWSADLTTDFNYSSTTGETQFFVKKAYLQGAFSDLATLRAGSANMPWIPFAEDWYGYRYVENTLTDRLHQANSADWGLHTLGDNGMFDYQVSVVNGSDFCNRRR